MTASPSSTKPRGPSRLGLAALAAVLAIAVSLWVSRLWVSPSITGITAEGADEPGLGDGDELPRGPGTSPESAPSLPLQRQAADAPPEVQSGIDVRVHYENGLPAAEAVVDVFLHGVEPVATDQAGQASLLLKPGSYEVFLRQGQNRRNLVIPAPQGRSSAEVDVLAGTRTELELTLYRGAAIDFLFENTRGDPQELQGVALFAFEESGWAHRQSFGRTSNGRCSAEGLDTGTYGLVPNEDTFQWFAPIVVEVVRGELKTVQVICSKVRKYPLHVNIKRAAGDATLPLWVEASSVLLGGWTLPIPRRFARAFSSPTGPGGVTIALAPGHHRLTFYATKKTGPATQVLPRKSWEWEVYVPTEGEPEWPEFELIFPELGPIASISGRALGAKTPRKGRCRLSLEGSANNSLRAVLWPSRETEEFFLIVDLDFLANSTASLEYVIGSQTTPLGQRELAVGEQSWVIELPPE